MIRAGKYGHQPGRSFGSRRQEPCHELLDGTGARIVPPCVVSPVRALLRNHFERVMRPSSPSSAYLRNGHSWKGDCAAGPKGKFQSANGGSTPCARSWKKAPARDFFSLYRFFFLADGRWTFTGALDAAYTEGDFEAASTIMESVPSAGGDLCFGKVRSGEIGRGAKWSCRRTPGLPLHRRPGACSTIARLRRCSKEIDLAVGQAASRFAQRPKVRGPETQGLGPNAANGRSLLVSAARSKNYAEEDRRG